MRLSVLEFRSRFTQAELRRLYAVAATPQGVDIKIYMDNLASVDPAEGVHTTDERVQAGVQSLAAAGLLDEPAADRVAAILSDDAGAPVVTTQDGYTLGQMVRVLAPFDAAFPGTYAVAGFGPEAVLLDCGASMAAHFLEAA